MYHNNHHNEDPVELANINFDYLQQLRTSKMNSPDVSSDRQAMRVGIFTFPRSSYMSAITHTQHYYCYIFPQILPYICILLNEEDFYVSNKKR